MLVLIVSVAHICSFNVLLKNAFLSKDVQIEELILNRAFILVSFDYVVTRLFVDAVIRAVRQHT